MSELQRLRIDKWLWAARFYKTRSIAKAAIEGGKVHCNGARVKVSKEIQIGDEIRVRQGFDEKTVSILKLMDKRGGAPIAQTLYEETRQSIDKREMTKLQRQQANHIAPQTKPSKKQRRQLQQVKHEQL